MPTPRHVPIGNLTLGNDRPLVKSDLARMETCLHAVIAKFKTRMTIRIAVIVASLDAVVFACLKLT